MEILVHSLVKNCLVLTMVDERQKWPPQEIGRKSGHLGTQFSKELPCFDDGSRALDMASTGDVSQKWTS